MPCYYWKGIDLSGSIQKGTQFSRSENHLEQELLSRNVGLIECRLTYNGFKQYIPVKLKDYFTEHLYTLLKSQIRLHQAIELTSHSIQHAYFKQIICDIGSIVLEGQFLYQAMESYSYIFDRLTINIVYVGEKSSNLTNAFGQLLFHRTQVSEFRAKMKSALFMPLLTFGFFILTMSSFFIFIVPRFETFFRSFKTPLPKITQWVLLLSNFIRSKALFYFSLIYLVAYILLRLFKLSIFSFIRDMLPFKIPLINHFSFMIYKLRFLQILSLSLSSGMHLLGCLNLSYNIIENSYIKKIIKELNDKVESGVSLSLALEESKLYDLETVALIKIGESSGGLEQMISRSLILYQKKFYLKIDQMSSLVHPILLLVLGILIASSIFAVYIPIFTLTSFIN